MNNLNITTIIIPISIIIIITIIILFIIQTNKSNNSTNIENYRNDLFQDIELGQDNNYWNELEYDHGPNNIDCYKLNQRDCMKYANCGLCLKNGRKECVPGDTQGPFFKEDCEGWMHTDYYDRHIFNEKVVTISPPWSKFYPDYEVRYPSPKSRATL